MGIESFNYRGLRLHLLNLSLLLAGASCGAGQPPAPQSSTPNTSAETCVAPNAVDPAPAGESIADACARLSAAREAWRVMVLGAGDASDVPALTASCVGIATLPGSRVTPMDIEACVARLRAGCQSSPKEYPSCFGFGWNLLAADLRGTLPAGSACSAGLQCDSGNCVRPFGSCGVCRNRRQPGEPCDAMLDECRESACENGVCVLLGKKLGDKCSIKGNECQSPLYCEWQTYVCVPRIAPGGACDWSDSCADGHHCRAGTCARILEDGEPCPDARLDRCEGVCEAGRCVPLRRDLGVGADCTLHHCDIGLDCVEDVCVKQDWPARGEQCTWRCDSGLTCEPEAFSMAGRGTCVDTPRAGQPCSRLAVCEPGAACHGFNPAGEQRGTCVALSFAGGACPCHQDLLCAGGTCVAYGAAYSCK